MFCIALSVDLSINVKFLWGNGGIILFTFICNTFSLSFKHKSSEENDICLLAFIRLLFFLFSFFKLSDDTPVSSILDVSCAKIIFSNPSS